MKIQTDTSNQLIIESNVMRVLTPVLLIITAGCSVAAALSASWVGQCISLGLMICSIYVVLTLPSWTIIFAKDTASIELIKTFCFHAPKVELFSLDCFKKAYLEEYDECFRLVLLIGENKIIPSPVYSGQLNDSVIKAIDSFVSQ